MKGKLEPAHDHSSLEHNGASDHTNGSDPDAAIDLEAVRINERISNRKRDKRKRERREVLFEEDGEADVSSLYQQRKRSQRLKRCLMVYDERTGKMVALHRHKDNRASNDWDDNDVE